MYQYFSKNPKRDHLRYRITVSGLIVSSVYALINFDMFGNRRRVDRDFVVSIHEASLRTPLFTSPPPSKVSL